VGFRQDAGHDGTYHFETAASKLDCHALRCKSAVYLIYEL